MAVAQSLAMIVPPVQQEGHPVCSTDQLLALADEYYNAAQMLEHLARAGAPASRAPYRLVAIHAVELYLSAFLLSVGQSSAQIRSYGHNLAERIAQATPHGLILRQRTLAHLALLTDTREYLMSRYQVDSAKTLSQPNRLAATMREVRFKVLLKLAPPAA